MVKEIARIIKIPEGVSTSLSQDVFTARGPKGTVERKFWFPGIKIEVREREVLIDAGSVRIEQKAMVGTFASHIVNLVKGVSEGFECKMTIVYANFPMQVKVEGRRNELLISGINKDDVGQTAANIEQKTKIRRFDPRVFQDGIYIVQKA